ncbi:MAG: hypothetical protein HeimC3_39730 [Candidatus Heimdallarchaeota archaeon LC_3]|nr:MAG: hypothetical protein HeimC3_39730 [Candidatus Heimdallarchaeota archaeon LC_3]
MREHFELITKIVEETELDFSDVHFSLFSFDRESLLVRFPERFRLKATNDYIRKKRKAGLLEVDSLFLDPRSTPICITLGRDIIVAHQLNESFENLKKS